MSTFKDLLTAANTIEENNLHKNEKIPEVIAAFKKCYDLDPSNEETKRKYLSYFKRQFELEHSKKNQEELKVLGNAQVQQNRYEEAVIIYNASIDLDPSIESAAPIYSNRSLAFFNLGRFKEAEDDGCIAIFLKPEFARGYLRRGNAAMKLEKWKESSEAFEKYFELDPETAKSDFELANNKMWARRNADQQVAEKRNHDQQVENTKRKLMAIQDVSKRRRQIKLIFRGQLKEAAKFDVDLVRMLVECGADLAGKIDEVLSAQNRIIHPTASDIGDSVFMSLMMLRRIVSPKKIVSQLDELIFFVIDEMLRQDAPFMGCELGFSCSQASGSLNPKLVRMLLETNKFDVNEGFAIGWPPPLVAVVRGLGDADSLVVSSEGLDCLHLLLNWKGIDVNRIWRFISSVGEFFEEITALGWVQHPEVAKLLIRHGANVNAATTVRGRPNTVLDYALLSPHNPHLEELIRLLIQSGARLLARGGTDGSKSTCVISRLMAGVPRPGTTTIAADFVPEEVLQMMLQLANHQGLGLTCEDPVTGEKAPPLFVALESGAPLRFIELLCAMNPAAIRETAIDAEGQLTIITQLIVRIGSEQFSFEESMKIFGILLEYGLDLAERTSVGVNTPSVFTLLWNVCRDEKRDVNLLRSVIIEKRGRDELSRCMSMKSETGSYVYSELFKKEKQ